ncbi:MAG: ABC transporter ATP-binding protein [Clostridiales bacterium]|nr:ABC transporter ATP-binding protein [Clostridiales bacterium]
MLRTEKLSFAYKTKGGRIPVFKNIDISFTSGLNVILGPNGAGKSTLLKSMFGLLRYKGSIWYENENVTKMPSEEKTKLMSYLPQMDIDTSALTVLEMVLLGRLPELRRKVSSEDLKSVMDTLEALNIKDLAPRPFSDLSGGQKKLVFIAQTLVREPRVILLDEPVNSLDLQRQLELCRLLRRIVNERQVSIIVVLHDINLACRFADHVVVLRKDGSLHSSGVPREVINEEMIRSVYGVVSKVSCDENGVPVVSAISSVRDV